jgi:predicted transcriptional regulator
MANLANNTDRRIVQFLLEQQGQFTFNDIIKHTEKAPSTISWHLKNSSYNNHYIKYCT